MNRDCGESETVLIIENSYIQAYVLQRMLAGIGFRNVTICGSGAEAPERILGDRPDLILISVELKGEPGGLEVIQEVREQYFNPVIFMTSTRDPFFLGEIESVPNSRVLSKPVRYKQFVSVFGGLMNRQSSFMAASHLLQG